MDLRPFGNAIGISDILGYRDCPARFAMGMRRHLGDEPPVEGQSTSAYGSAIHDAIHLVDAEALSHEVAISRVLERYAPYLNPEHSDLLREDLAIFESRRPLGVTLVASEKEMRVPLYIDEDFGQIYFRFRLDVLYRLISNPAIFLSRDYKSSAHVKSQAEVHSDLQQWAYNFGIHEYFPECQRLIQTYDQLKYGEVQTSKNDAQRAQMKRWLIDNVRVILRDERLAPKLNQWCRFCPLVVTCRETRRATSYWRGKLAVTAPLTKEGRKTRVAFFDEGDELERVIRDGLPEMAGVRKHIEHVEKTLKEVIREMPDEDRQRLGWRLQARTSKSIPPEGLKEIHEMLGDSFYELVSIPQTAIDSFFGKPKKKGEPVSAELQTVRNWLLTRDMEPNVVPAN